MSVKFTVVHRKDLNNVGDMASNPLQYFLKPSEYQVVDLENLGVDQFRTDLPVIAGGGGLIANSWFGDILEKVLSSADRIKLLEMWSQTWNVSDPINADLRKEFTTKVNHLVRDYISKLQPSSNAPRIIWGAGHNSDTNKKIKSGQLLILKL